MLRSDWYIMQEDRWGFEEVYDGPFRSHQEAENEIHRLVNRDGLDSWAADLYVSAGSPKTSFCEGVNAGHN